MVTIQPLNIADIFLNFLAGSPVIFAILGLLAIFIIGSKTRMPIGALGIFGVVFLLIAITPDFESEPIRMIAFITFVVLAMYLSWVLKKVVTKN